MAGAASEAGAARVQGFKLHPNFDLVLTPVTLQ